ncbi:MAG: hypothetical protein CL677_10240, partial [Bdellovibrionaceae bacterium]|nr:hypothetical protein [Pseudobdellovibrionaceae bacterium]
MLVSLFQNKNKNWLKFALSLQMALGSLPLVTSSQAISDDDLTKPQYAENGLGEDVMALTRQSYRIIEKDQTSRMRSWADAAIKALGGENSAAAKVLSPFSSRAGGESGRYNLSEGDIMTPYRGVPTNISKLRVTSGPSSSGDTHSIFIELEEGRRVHQHEIAGFTEFTTTPKLNPQDNVVFFATKERGVFAIPLRIYQQGLFKGPIPVIHVFGNPPFPGAEITNIHSEKVYRPSDLELAEENKAFEVLTDRSPLLRDGSNVSDDLLIKASDVTITYKWTDKSGETHVLDHVYNLQDVMKVMVDKLLAVYAGGIVASGDIERYQEIKALMDTRAELTNAAISEMNRIIGDPSEHKVEANVDMLALKNVISHPSMKDGWSKVVPGKNGTSTLDQIYGMDRDQFEVREVRKSYQEVILASEEQEARARSDAQQSLEEYNSRKSVVRDGLNIVKYTIAKVRGYSSAYWFRFAQIYMKHMHHSTYSGLAKAATTVSAGASTYAAVLTASQTGFGPEFVLDFHQQILEGMRIVVDSSQMVFTNSIELIKATFGYESAMNAAYAAAGSISAQAIYFGFYGFLPYILKNAANRGASHAKISYEAMKRWFAKLNYGLAAHYHESIMNQQLLYRVLDAGYKPSDFPGIVTHSRNASKATIRAQADEINAEMKLDELAKYRA